MHFVVSVSLLLNHDGIYALHVHVTSVCRWFSLYFHGSHYVVVRIVNSLLFVPQKDVSVFVVGSFPVFTESLFVSIERGS